MHWGGAWLGGRANNIRTHVLDAMIRVGYRLCFKSRVPLVWVLVMWSFLVMLPALIGLAVAVAAAATAAGVRTCNSRNSCCWQLPLR